MKNTLKISIKQPCSEKFNSFTKTASGGFCQSCSKEVIDFTNKTDKEVLEYFKNNDKKTCGNFYEKQLKTYTERRTSKELKKYSFISAFSFSIISLFTSNSVIAQKNTNDTIINQPKKVFKGITLVTHPTIKGTVVSKTDNIPIPGVSIILKNSVLGTETDFDGFFKINNINEGAVLSIYAIGYKSQEIIITKNQSILNIKLEEDNTILGGVILAGKVDVRATYKTKRTLKQRIKSIF